MDNIISVILAILGLAIGCYLIVLLETKKGGGEMQKAKLKTMSLREFLARHNSGEIVDPAAIDLNDLTSVPRLARVFKTFKHNTINDVYLVKFCKELEPGIYLIDYEQEFNSILEVIDFLQLVGYERDCGGNFRKKTG